MYQAKLPAKSIFLAVYNTGIVIDLSGLTDLPGLDLVYLIHCKFRKWTGGQSCFAYYDNRIFDSQHDRIVDNIIDWSGIKCQFEELEYWGPVKEGSLHQGIILKINIWDELNNLKTLTFDVSYPKIRYRSFQEIFTYLNRLKQARTFHAFNLLEEKDKEIVKLKNNSE
jgi:hypothetical protein